MRAKSVSVIVFLLETPHDCFHFFLKFLFVINELLRRNEFLNKAFFDHNVRYSDHYMLPVEVDPEKASPPELDLEATDAVARLEEVPREHK